MKKNLFLIALTLICPAVIAAENLDAKSGEEAALSKVTNEIVVPSSQRVLPESLSSTSALSELKSDPGNFEAKGGVAGLFSESALSEQAILKKLSDVTEFYNDLKRHHGVLLTQLGVANESLRGMQALQRALEEAQQQRDKEVLAKETLESRLKAAEARATFLKEKEEKLLLESDRKDAAMVLEKARKEYLEKENLLLKEIIAEFAANAKKVESLLAENSDYNQILQASKDDAVDVENTRQGIRKVVEENEKMIRELQEKNRVLANHERETREKISKLEQAIKENDHYTLVLEKIRDRRVKDEDLALYIWSIRTVIGADLDQLSQGREERLIEALIRVSKPYDQRPYGHVTCTYEGCFRTLGNQFVSGGLVWVGTSFDLRDCTYEKSKFARTSTDVARFAKDQLSRK